MDIDEFLQECDWFDWDVRDMCDEISPANIDDPELAQKYANLQTAYFELREYLSNEGIEL